ncbi:MAG: DUF1657 domain-containing protein [Halanaerobiales bacterium]
MSPTPGSEDRLNQAITQLKEAKQEIEAFASETQDKNVKKLYKDGATQIEQVVNSIRGRSRYINEQNKQENVNNMDLE